MLSSLKCEGFHPPLSQHLSGYGPVGRRTSMIDEPISAPAIADASSGHFRRAGGDLFTPPDNFTARIQRESVRTSGYRLKITGTAHQAGSKANAHLVKCVGKQFDGTKSNSEAATRTKTARIVEPQTLPAVCLLSSANHGTATALRVRIPRVASTATATVFTAVVSWQDIQCF